MTFAVLEATFQERAKTKMGNIILHFKLIYFKIHVLYVEMGAKFRSAKKFGQSRL